MVIFIVFGILFVIVLIILCSKLTIGFTFKMENLVCSAYVVVYLFGKIPAKKIMLYPSNKNKKKRTKPKKVLKKRDLNQLQKSLWVLIKLFYNNVLVRKFILRIRAGTGDASQTALLYGFLWSMTSLIPGKLLNNFSVKEKEIHIEADFKQKVWKADFECIFSLKIVNIISMVSEIIKLSIKSRKGGDAGVRASNRRSNDYSHAKY